MSSTYIPHVQPFAARPPMTSTDTELRRLINLPIVGPTKAIDAVSKMFMSAKAYGEGKRLLIDQCNAFVQFAGMMKSLKPGLFGPLGVGAGKTLSSFGIANMVIRPDIYPFLPQNPVLARKVMLVIPPQLERQTRDEGLPFARRMLPFCIPVHFLTGANRITKASSDEPGLYISTYSRLSQPDAEEIMALLDPDMVICDESQNLARSQAARTKRFKRMMRGRARYFVALSGSMTRRAPTDYAHLVEMALGDAGFLPSGHDDLEFWSAVLGSRGEPSDKDCDALKPLVTWAQKNFDMPVVWEDVEKKRDAIRRAFDLRRRTCPGVVQSSDLSLPTSLSYSKVDPGPNAEVKKFMDDLETTWTTPGGDELDHAIEKYRVKSELSLGFWSKMEWPDHPLVHLGKELLAARQAYHKALRQYFQHPHKGLDTPLLVGKHLYLHGGKQLGQELFELWKINHELSAKAKAEKWPERLSIPQRISDWKIREALKVVQSWPKGEGGIVWCTRREIEKWTVEHFREAGLHCVHAPAASHVLDPEHLKVNGDKIIVASIESHGTGKNLQCFKNNLFLCNFPHATLAEQAVGRTHRTGQEADHLDMQIMLGTSHDDDQLAAVINDATYVHCTMSPQKLLYGDWTFRPNIKSSSYLKAIGANVDELTIIQAELLKEKFG